MITHGNARGSVKSGDDPIWRVDVGVVDVVLAPVTCVDWVKTWSNTQSGISGREVFARSGETLPSPVSNLEFRS